MRTESRQNTNSSVNQAKEYIYSIDFSPIINKMVTQQKWRKEEAETVCKLYRNFLFLNVKYHQEAPLPPSEEIDEFWHNHILDTEKYHQDCLAIFGRYLHHYPYLGIDGKTTMKDLGRFFEKTQEIYFKEFGDYIYKVKRNYVISRVLSVLSWFEKQGNAHSKNLNYESR